MFLVSENKEDNYSVLTYAKLALRRGPDLVVIYSQKGNHAEARRFIEQSGSDVYTTELPFSEGLRQSILLKEVSPARYAYFIDTLKNDANAKVPRVSAQVMAKTNKNVAFIPGNLIAKEPSKNMACRRLR